MTAVTYRTLASRAELDAHAARWDELVRAAARPSPFLLHGWLSAWWEHHGHERELRVEAAFDGGELVGGVPLELQRRPGLRVAHFMGRHHAALGDLLVAPERRAEVVPGLLARLREAPADYVDLFGLAEGGLLYDAVAGDGRGLIQRVEAPVLDLEGGWDAVYRAKTSSKRRNLHKRRRRQLAELGELEVEVASEEDALVAALEDAFRLHDLRWSGRPDGSEFTTPAGKAFHVAAIRALARLGIPRILTLRVDGRAVAFHYYFLLENRMYVHRLAFDPALARYSPGQVATLDAIESAAGEGATRVEFLGGGERYKLELADRVEPLYALVGLPSSLRGRLAAAATVGGVELRLRLKRSERLHRLYLDGLGSVRRLAGRRPDPPAD